MQFVPRRVAGFRQVHFRAVYEVVEVAGRNMVALHGVVEGGQNQAVAVISGKGPVERLPPRLHLLGFRLVFRRLIGNIVAVAHERVDGAHRRLPLRRQGDKRVVKVTRLRFGDVFAVPVRGGELFRVQMIMIASYPKNKTREQAQR